MLKFFYAKWFRDNNLQLYSFTDLAENYLTSMLFKTKP